MTSPCHREVIVSLQQNEAALVTATLKEHLATTRITLLHYVKLLESFIFFEDMLLPYIIVGP